MGYISSREDDRQLIESNPDDLSPSEYHWNYWWPRIVAECDAFESQLEEASYRASLRRWHLFIIALGLLFAWGMVKKYERETLSKSLDNSFKDESLRDYRLNYPDHPRRSYPRSSGGGGVPYT